MDMLRGQFLISHKLEWLMANEVCREIQFVLYYFSATWCPPCQTFLPKLKSLYEEVRVRALKLEIIFVPSDHNNDDMMHQFVIKHGTWVTTPVGSLAEKLRAKYHVMSIPTIIVVTKDGHVITKNGRRELEDQGDDVLATWFPESSHT